MITDLMKESVDRMVALFSEVILSFISVVMAGRLMCLRKNIKKNKIVIKREFIFNPSRSRGRKPAHPVMLVSEALLIFFSSKCTYLEPNAVKIKIAVYMIPNQETGTSTLTI